MDEIRYYIGADLKFKVTLTAPGFSQASDKYDIILESGGMKEKYTQDNIVERDGEFYLPVSTARLGPGMAKMIVTAYVPDDDFPGGIRKEIAVHTIGPFKPVR